ncbi:hypothetical protein XO10_05535 [Marinitoga sp. 1135]|uniref:Uncharacterized protein n=1 Tax=Marinitoga piezophila (strain DSM 14283 / JCM 11233 / KA3) TaxID=443254 RepID=H2J836_MARPK|nr:MULTISPECIES: hypothetical protein [Marinitoga]AEX85527.1 hypothetical protein Marpi_1115 [Marinitoga piezophila KA3]APT75993.1 hypothetical protein LN42_06080 [Marinitoga sp. 1137]NUU95734.1 hypothetical protein [Marinitoga sp. 1135]NUU97665.1 hypothetical protein [Marinitoga sp. 1138]
MKSLFFNKYFYLFELLFIYAVLLATGENRVYGLFLILAVVIEIYKDIFSKEIDEMERYLRFKISNVVLYSTVVFSIILYSFNIKMLSVYNVLLFYMAFPLVLKSMLYAGYIFERETVIKRVGYSLSLLLLIFTILSEGFSFAGLIEAMPWIYLIISTFVATRYRKIGSFMFFVAFVVVSYYFIRGSINDMKIVVYSFIGIPLLFLSLQSLRKEGD